MLKNTVNIFNYFVFCLLDCFTNIFNRLNFILNFFYFLVSQLSQLNSSMKLETRLTELNQMIKSTVGLNKADPDICIKLLDEYKCKLFFKIYF